MSTNQLAVMRGTVGAGKTKLTASFANLAHPPFLIVDFGVDTANLTLLLQPGLLCTLLFIGMDTAQVD
ncbi:MAG: hypothetical protein NT074_02930 [Methanomicrobiales archaeon]|nr:hypothetical protein [Methanomicrobiales archaeon]